MLETQRTDGMVLLQRLVNSGRTNISLKAGKDQYLCSRQTGELLLPSGGVSFLVLFRPSTDWMRSTCIEEGNLPQSTVRILISSTNIWAPSGPVKLTHKINYQLSWLLCAWCAHYRERSIETSTLKVDNLVPSQFLGLHYAFGALVLGACTFGIVIFSCFVLHP